MKKLFTLAVLCLCMTLNAANLRFSSMLGDNMVLQQNATVKIWGYASPGASVSVSTSWGASGSARANFYGRIYVAQDAQKTKAYQENHNILASEKAKIGTKPQLEIYADDVECSHGATIGRLNEDEQFYMRSRGIPEAEARVLQMISFLAPVAGLLPEDLANQVYESLSQCQD